MSFLSRRRADETITQVTAALSIDVEASAAQQYQSSGAETDHQTSGRPRLRGRSSVANAGGAKKSLTARPNDRNLSQNCGNSKRPQRLYGKACESSPRKRPSAKIRNPCRAFRKSISRTFPFRARTVRRRRAAFP